MSEAEDGVCHWALVWTVLRQSLVGSEDGGRRQIVPIGERNGEEKSCSRILEKRDSLALERGASSSWIEMRQSNHRAQNSERFLRISVLYISHVDESIGTSQRDERVTMAFAIFV